MTVHLLWLWLWFAVGTLLYILKRAYYLVTGPNPVATTYGQFFEKCWIPLLIRTGVDSGIFWACFTPQLLAQGLASLGWSSFSGVVALVTQFAVCAFFFGMGVDMITDMALSKLPVLKDFLPQMPPPLQPPNDSK